MTSVQPERVFLSMVQVAALKNAFLMLSSPSENERSEAQDQLQVAFPEIDLWPEGPSDLGSRPCVHKDEAEIARLRAALLEIAGFDSDMDGTSEIARIACAALDGDTNT